MGLGFDFEGFKRFWSSRSVHISVAIFLGIAAVMGVIMLVAVLAGCGTTSNYYTTVNKPTLIHLSNGRHNRATVAYFVVANPTSVRKHYVFRCCVPNTKDCLPDQHIIVPPRSDKKLFTNTMSSVNCWLESDSNQPE